MHVLSMADLPKANRTYTLALLSTKYKTPILHRRHKHQIPSLKPPLQLLLRPITARDDEQAAVHYQRYDFLPITLTEPPTRSVFLLRQADGVEGAFVEHDVPASVLRTV